MALSGSANTGGISYGGENVVPCVQMGRVRTMTPATGAETTYPAAVILYGVDFNVIW